MCLLEFLVVCTYGMYVCLYIFMFVCVVLPVSHLNQPRLKLVINDDVIPITLKAVFVIVHHRLQRHTHTERREGEKRQKQRKRELSHHSSVYPFKKLSQFLIKNKKRKCVDGYRAGLCTAEHCRCYIGGLVYFQCFCVREWADTQERVQAVCWTKPNFLGTCLWIVRPESVCVCVCV